MNFHFFRGLSPTEARSPVSSRPGAVGPVLGAAAAADGQGTSQSPDSDHGHAAVAAGGDRRWLVVYGC